MPALAPAAFALAVVVFVSQSGRIGRLDLTAPIVFTALGVVFADVFFTGHVETVWVRTLAELTLALVLFHDAAQVRPRQLRRDARLFARLLALGLPMTMIFGFGAALPLFHSAGIWLALLLAAALTPTDAGLGAATVLNPVVPARVRRLLNVESGLNDGLSTPVVLFAIAAAGASAGSERGALTTALRELVVGLVVGILLGMACGLLLSRAHSAGWLVEELLPIGTLSIPMLTYYGAVGLGGNGFISAFVSGTAFAAAVERRSASESARRAAESSFGLAESLSLVLGYATWTLFGMVGVARLFSIFTWQGLVFACLSLTVLRIGPVALALLGTGFKPRTVLFIGWFGPRGLASVVFALLAAESLGHTPELGAILGAIVTTVLLSVALHGLTAVPWAASYGAWVAREQPTKELAGAADQHGATSPVPGV